MPRKLKPDTNATIAKLVKAATGTEPVRGEDLLGSPQAKRLLRKAKLRAQKLT